MPEVTLIPNVSINIVTKFKVSILKNDEVRGGGYFNPSPLRRISWQRGLRGIGLIGKSVPFRGININNGLWGFYHQIMIKTEKQTI